jgi:hypothetical protein
MDRTSKKWFFILIGNAIALRLIYQTQVTQYPTLRRDMQLDLPPISRRTSISVFDQIVKEVYSHDVCDKNDIASTPRTRKEFDLEEWRQHSTTGGLKDDDRKMLAKYYGSANSVFEWGLGESSYMAGYFNVPRYAGVDSDATWVSNARDKVRTDGRKYTDEATFIFRCFFTHLCCAIVPNPFQIIICRHWEDSQFRETS